MTTGPPQGGHSYGPGPQQPFYPAHQGKHKFSLNFNFN